MKIKLLMDKHKDSESQWCGTYYGLFGTISTIFRGIRYGYRRFDFSK